ncbi:MAG: hypothetical protein AAB131_16035 [Actinomycetota bacterium]|jgi:hypothetical protein|nr:MAG: hypothetical protein FD127_2987 [Acidimicrobiaceae bacterium]
MKRSIWAGISALTIAGTLAVGGTASANEGGDTGNPGGDRVARVCNNLDTINAQLDQRLAEIQRRIDWLTEKRARAEAAGRTDLVARIDAALAKLNDRATRVQARKDKLAAWAAEHCTTTA